MSIVENLIANGVIEFNPSADETLCFLCWIATLNVYVYYCSKRNAKVINLNETTGILYFLDFGNEKRVKSVFERTGLFIVQQKFTGMQLI